jgi:transketolase
LLAAEILAEHGIEARVINNASVKPMDEKTILAAARECGAIVTVEEAQAAAGMGSAVCEFLASECPVPIERIGMQDCFGQSGTPQELLEYYGLTAPSIVKAAKMILKKKNTR